KSYGGGGFKQRPASAPWQLALYVSSLGLLAALCLGACRSPGSEYKILEEKVNRGEFDSALVDSDAALRRYEGRNDEWEWRFRILKTRILISRSQAREALSILKPEAPAALATTEIPEQRRLYRGIAHRYTQEFAIAERDFEE